MIRYREFLRRWGLYHNGNVTILGNMKNQILNEVFFSVDGEFDGSHPPKHSMLSLGVVAFTLKDGVIGEFSRNIWHHNAPAEPFKSKAETEQRTEWLASIGLPSSHTMDRRVWDEFWSRFPDAFAATQVDRVVPAVAMNDFQNFYIEMVTKVGGSFRDGVFIEYPGGIDYFWCHWYFMEYLNADPFGHSRNMSMKSYASAVMHEAFRHSTNRNMPKRWFASKLKHNHIAVDDARGQAHLAIRMMCENLEIELPPL
jgi:hypothetical protein